MRNHTLNLFRINNLPELDFSYKLVDFKLPVIAGQEDRYNKQLQKIAQQVSSRSEGPTAIVKRDGRHYVAIPADNELDEAVINVVPFNIRVRLLPEVYKVNVTSATNDTIDVVQKFLDFEIRKQLSRHRELWKLNSAQFYSKSPVHAPEESNIHIYEGFSYRLVRLGNNTFYICLDLSTKYIDKHFFSSYVNEKNVNTIGANYRGRRFLYLNGDNWYAIELAGYGEQIQHHELDHEGTSIDVYNYILKKAGGRKDEIRKVVKPTDLTMLYTYPGRTMEPHSGAVSLAKMLYSTQDQEVQSLHGFSIKDPTRRFEAIEHYVKTFFGNIRFNQTPVKISKNPSIEKVLHFSIPELKYNHNQVLKTGHYSTGANTSLRDFAGERKQYLLSNGILNKDPFDEQFLLVPDNMDRKLVEAFKKNAEHQIKVLAPAFTGFTVIRYTAKPNQSATFQIQEIEQVLRQHHALSGFALFILPDLTFESKKYISSFHDCLKNKFYPNLKVQCASAHKIRSFFKSYPSTDGYEFKVSEDRRPKFRSYLLNLILEHLIVNRKWPYALATDLHYDVYVGIDVHDRYAGFTIFLKNGENIFFFPEKVPLKNHSQRAEKLKANLLYNVIFEKLKMLLPRFCPQPNGIVIIRDGRSFGEEGKALKKVIMDLTTLGITSTNTKYGVMDLHKQSAIPMRIASQTNGYNRLENPMAGTYKILDGAEAFLFNTGFPFQIRGSAKPLHISLQEGNVIFKDVLEDIFCQTILAFSAPDRSNSLPVTIKLIDALLEPLSSKKEIEEDDEEYEDSTIENF
jgi:hypothetical protein